MTDASAGFQKINGTRYDGTGLYDAEKGDIATITVEKGGHDVRKEMYRTLDEQGNNVYLTWLSQQSRPGNAVTREAAYWPLAAAAAAVALAAMWVFRSKRRAAKG